jgi:putative sterol carrier protein
VSDVISDFFGALAERKHEPLLRNANGSLRYDIANGSAGGEHWHIAVTKGDVVVTRANEPADCVMRVPRDVFARMATGEENAVAAVLRGAVKLEGNWELLVLFQRIFPGPPVAAAK